MADRPILFSGPMVRALIEGRKTQTRRVLKPQPPAGGGRIIGPEWYEPEVVDRRGELVPGDPVWGCYDEFGTWGTPVRFAPGDRLWVRESWYAARSADDVAPRDMDASWKVCPVVDWNYADWGLHGRHRQGMHMPRWASRLTLIVTDVRVQRLREIGLGDAMAEGVPDEWRGKAGHRVSHFRELWDGLNAGRGFGWAANPWVVAVTFTVHRQNIDRLHVSPGELETAAVGGASWR